MNDKNKQVILLFAIVVLVASVAMDVGTDVVLGLAGSKMTAIQKDMENEKLLAKKNEEEKKAAEEVEKEKALSKNPNQNNTTNNANSQNNKANNANSNNTINKNNVNNNKKESLENIIGNNSGNSNKADKTKNHCFNKNGKLYYKGVCVPIPRGFKYLMKQDGFMAYTDANYQKIFMVYVEEHYMDNPKDGLENFTYGIGNASVVKDGPKNMKFGKNFYQRYMLEAEGINTYAFITASKNRIAFIHVVSADGSVGWAKASLTNLTYYN